MADERYLWYVICGLALCVVGLFRRLGRVERVLEAIEKRHASPSGSVDGEKP